MKQKKILELNVICSPKAIQFKEAVKVITNEIDKQKEDIEQLKKIISYKNSTKTRKHRR